VPVPASDRASKARVLIVEDDPFVRSGLADLLDGQGDLVCCGQEGSLAGAARAVAQVQPDLVLIDLQLEDGDSLGLIHSLRFQYPHLATLVLSHQDEALYAPQALQAGAQGYLMKEAAAEHLLSAISKVLAGKTYLSEAMAARLYPLPQSRNLGPGC
jgi:DNA-binding NarL/FixJ family response regulator